MSHIDAETSKRYLTVYLPDTRGVTVSCYGKGNLKIGLEVYTYSRLPGHPQPQEQDTRLTAGVPVDDGTCPGSTPECEAICYAKRVVMEWGVVSNMWAENSLSEDVPPIPDECKLLRLHIGGDFTSVEYIENWIARLTERPDVICWAYTRSWRVPELLPALERLRALPNMQLFASMDSSTPELPRRNWRRAWIEGDERLGPRKYFRGRLQVERITGFPSYVCPEETGHKPNCAACNYCLKGKRGDVTFLRH